MLHLYDTTKFNNNRINYFLVTLMVYVLCFWATNSSQLCVITVIRNGMFELVVLLMTKYKRVRMGKNNDR